ncbi:MAG: hypothetical protein ABIT96_02240 [Ferruginibacter sp.]
MKHLLTLLVFCCPCILLFSCNSKKGKKPSEESIRTTMAFDTANRMVDLSGEKSLRSLVSQNWEYEEDAEEAERMKLTDGLEVPYRSICFSEDGTYIKNPRGSFSTGAWKLDSEKKPVVISCASSDKESFSYLLARVSAENMVLNLSGEKNNIELVSSGWRYKNEKENPFHISNNGWRIKPGKSETPQAIKERLRGCLDFFILFYDDHIYRKTQVVSLYGLPSPFRWYAGGIYLQKKDKLNPNWVSSYYNESEAMKSYALADKLLSQKYTWPKGEKNWLKQNVYVLRQMKEKLESL